jgi:hypothetical protein
MKKLHRPDEKKFVPAIFQILRNIALDNVSSCILWMFRMCHESVGSLTDRALRVVTRKVLGVHRPLIHHLSV